MTTVPLRNIAYARSGDKGSSANIGVIAYTPQGYHFLEEHLSQERVHEYFSPLEPKATTRYLLPNLLAFNFVLTDVLAGGGSRSLRTDAQGKTLGQALLEMPLTVPNDLLPQFLPTPQGEKS